MKTGLLRFAILICFLPVYAQTYGQATWTIGTDQINPNEYYGVTVANGMMGLISSPNPLEMKDIVLNGVFDTYGRGRVSNILRGFNFANLQLDVDGRRLGPKDFSNLSQEINMKEAVFISRFDYQDKISVTCSVRALRHLPFSAMVEMEIEAKKDVVISPGNVIRAPEILREVKNFYSMIDRPHVKIPLMTSVAQSPTGKHTVAASCSYLFEAHDNPALIHEEWDYDMHLVRFVKNLKAGERYRFSVVGSECSTAHYADPHNEAERLTIYAALEGRQRLISRHLAAWDDLWKSDIVIPGDEAVQRDVRFALYHLYSFVREGTAYSPSPMGLSGLGYNGHVFWDTELWMYPPLLLLHPEIARSLLEYRYERLEVAKQNARSHGYDGAMYPWESDGIGQEATPVWALTGPFEHHITGCIGWAFWKYYQVTGDKTWLRDRGWPVLKEVAAFWTSRVEKGSDGKYHIINVVAADEWAENVDDNAFTNAVAIMSLRYAVQAAAILGETPDPRWGEVAGQIAILAFPDGVTREHATYDGETIKQGDVNLLAYPLGLITDKKQIKKDLDYYEPRMSPDGPAMGHAVLSILHNRYGDSRKALELFVKGYKPNGVPPFGVMAETAGGTNPYFATGAGGMLQAVLSGFGGLEITDEGVSQVKSTIPGSWKSLTITGVGKDGRTFMVKP
ncbi:MAG: glycoside hydrolase family 65 protein [Bacteroidia bacterium]